MNDIELRLVNRPGELARFGRVLGKNKISLEGGGVFSVGEESIAHFLVTDGTLARHRLEENGFVVTAVNHVVTLRLRQEIPGQLGLCCQRFADAGINILVQYSDHDHQLILVVDDYKKAIEVSRAWMEEWWG